MKALTITMKTVRTKREPRRTADQSKKEHQDDLLDEGIEESFPASDPVSVKHIT